MTWEEKIKIDTNALLENLNEYRYAPKTYCGQAKIALSPIDLDKLIFCTQRIEEWFEETLERNEVNPDYEKLKRILLSLTQKKEEIEQRKREVVPFMQFWTAFKTWLNSEMEDPATLFGSKYKAEYSNCNNWYTVACVDNDILFKTIYGKSYVEMTEENISFQAIKDFVEVYYREVIEPQDGKYRFTIKVNELFARFQLSYKLQKGKLTQIGYKTTYKIDKIENHEQFERKIDFAAEMILYENLLDKHTSLNYISDAFCYFYSLYNSDKKLGELANSDNNTRVYSLVKNEVAFIGQVINNDFDIRHNEETSTTKNGQKCKRESLNDPIFIEYLYNRINALLTLLRIKRVQKQKSEVISEESIIENDELPF